MTHGPWRASIKADLKNRNRMKPRRNLGGSPTESVILRQRLIDHLADGLRNDASDGDFVPAMVARLSRAAEVTDFKSPEPEWMVTRLTPVMVAEIEWWVGDFHDGIPESEDPEGDESACAAFVASRVSP